MSFTTARAALDEENQAAQREAVKALESSTQKPETTASVKEAEFAEPGVVQ